MSRASNIEHAARINAAVSSLQQTGSSTRTVRMLCERFGMSVRQAYRYVKHAGALDGTVSMPEPKRVFTVKLPIVLIEEVRRYARKRRKNISDVVVDALKLFLTRE